MRQNKSKDKVGNLMSSKVAKGKKIHPTNTSSQPKQGLNATDNHNADKKNSCRAKPPMDSSIISLKQPFILLIHQANQNRDLMLLTTTMQIKNSCQAKPPMDSSIISLKQPKNGQSPGSVKNVSIYAKASKIGITNITKKIKEEVLDTTIQALITCLKDLKNPDASSGLQQGGSGNNRRKPGKKSNVEKKQY